MCSGACVHPPSRPYARSRGLKQRKHGNRAQTELAHRYGQGKCRKVQGWCARWTSAGMAHSCNALVRARKGLCRRRLCRRRCSRQFASMRAVQMYGYGQIWCRRSAWCICHVSMSNALPSCRPKIAFVSLVALCDLLGALGASAGRRRRVVGDVVSVHSSPAVPCQAAVQSMRPFGAWAEVACVRFLVGFGPHRLERRRQHDTCAVT
mmetsp:Transcript_45810/g.67161  ORF Transcript_45810/g.67161 Transcript_45810/m.67161 type:complete len:207 (-) Transcript_45810:125-745(-)